MTGDKPTLAHELALLPINYQAQGKTFEATVLAIDAKLESLVKALEAARKLIEMDDGDARTVVKQIRAALTVAGRKP